MNRSLHGLIPAVMLLAGATPALAAQGEGSPLLRFDPGVGVWALVVFILLMLLLRKFAWNPIIDALDAREKTVRESLEQASRIQSESARLAEEQARILAESRAQAASVLQTARESGEALKKKVEETAHQEKQRILEAARREIEAEKTAAVAELRKVTAELSVSIAEKLIRTNLDEAKTRKLVDELINEVSPKA